MKTFLFMAYVFPPTGGGGVQRAAKLAKYAASFGWRPVVVTPDRPSVNIWDQTLLDDLPRRLIVRKAPSFEPGLGQGPSTGGGVNSSNPLVRLVPKLLFPDRNILWAPTAFYAALAAARRYDAKAVLATAPPFSTFVLASAVARAAGLPLVVDFRDEWSGFFNQGYAANSAGPLRRWLVKRAEGVIVRQAAAVVGATPGMAERLNAMYGGLPLKFHTIFNGYDPADFQGRAKPYSPRPGRLRLTYAGLIFPPTSLDGFWRALALLPPEKRQRITVEIVGRVAAGQTGDPQLPGLDVVHSGYMPHHQAIERMAEADVLLLSVADMPGARRIATGKVFEYLAAGRPILAVAPPSVAAQVVEACGAGKVIHPSDCRVIAHTLDTWLQSPPPAPKPAPAAFSRLFQAGQFAAVLDQAAATARRGWPARFK